MNNKKNVMIYAGILIIIFHLWIYVSDINTNMYKIESFIRYISFIGVDIFFFVSAYSLSKNEIKDYKKFILQRFIKIYIIFILFSIVQFFYKNWSFDKLILTISSIDLFISGGGSFLWFIPSIMIMYIILPIIINNYSNKKVLLGLFIWLILAISLTITNNNQTLIFINRMPIILLGVFISKNLLLESIKKEKYIIISIILLIIGNIISYTTINLNFRFIYDIKYILNIPLIISNIMLIDLIKDNKVSSIVGKSTLYMYGIQMIFGFKLAELIFKLINVKLLSNFITIISIIVVSIFLNYINEKIYKVIIKKQK